ncbi:MAG: EamA family transporter [Acidobacteria bacterium]|nr:EamA family transporter [Acidobacteriota bacterium]
MKTAVVLAIAILANSAGNLLLTLGMRDFDGTAPSAGSWLARTARHVVSDPWMIGGVLLLIVFLSAYMTALSWADLSFVLPATAPAYILTVFLAKIFLQETVTPLRWGGTFLIVLGTCLVARSFANSGSAVAAPVRHAGEQSR